MEKIGLSIEKVDIAKIVQSKIIFFFLKWSRLAASSFRRLGSIRVWKPDSHELSKIWTSSDFGHSFLEGKNTTIKIKICTVPAVLDRRAQGIDSTVSAQS